MNQESGKELNCRVETPETFVMGLGSFEIELPKTKRFKKIRVVNHRTKIEFDVLLDKSNILTISLK